MNDFISITQHGDTFVVDSRLIADRLGIKHENFIETIRKYQTQAEDAFGLFRFETGSSTMPDGRANPKPEKFVLLTED